MTKPEGKHGWLEYGLIIVLIILVLTEIVMIEPSYDQQIRTLIANFFANLPKPTP